MGLDAVEIVLRTEELFVITIDDDEAAAVRTVGDFYKLVATKLSVVPLDAPITSSKLPIVTHKERTLLLLYSHTPLPAPPEVLPWSPQSIWDTLIAMLVDQQGLKAERISYTDRFVEDLGVC